MPSHNDDSGTPWGARPQSPPDIEQILKQAIERLKGIFPDGGSGKNSGGSFGGLFSFAILLLIGLGLWFVTPGARDPNQSARDGGRETQMVTGDLNAALVEWVVQYRISDPVKFLFEVREPGETLRYVSESVMREVVGDRTVDEVITIGRQEIEVEALVKMQELSTKYVMGISIDQVQLKNINPPRPVQESFNEVNQAQQSKEKLINEARREYNKVIPLAEGEKDQRIREADGYRLKRINEAEGDVARFNALFTEYQKAPEVTRRRIYIETMQAVMPNIASKILVDDDMTGLLPLLNLDGQKGQQP